MKRFADLSITEGVIVQMLIERVLADPRTLHIRIEVDGEEILPPTRCVEEIEKAYDENVFAQGHWCLSDPNNVLFGAVRLVHGNDEFVISDYSIGLEEIINPIDNFINNKAAA